MKYYAVKVGRMTGIYNTWDECKEQVDGFEGALYKSFSKLEDAQEYLLDGKKEKINTENITLVRKNKNK